jgi:hypothetical protein
VGDSIVNNTTEVAYLQESVENMVVVACYYLMGGMEAVGRNMAGFAAKRRIPQAALSMVEVLGIDRKDRSHMLVQKEENQQGCPASLSCVEEREDLLGRAGNPPDSH